MNFLELKRKYLFDANGSLRKGIRSMNTYWEVLSAEDEDTLNRVILKIMSEHPEFDEEE